MILHTRHTTDVGNIYTPSQAVNEKKPEISPSIPVQNTGMEFCSVTRLS